MAKADAIVHDLFREVERGQIDYKSDDQARKKKSKKSSRDDGDAKKKKHKRDHDVESTRKSKKYDNVPDELVETQRSTRTFGLHDDRTNRHYESLEHDFVDDSRGRSRSPTPKPKKSKKPSKETVARIATPEPMSRSPERNGQSKNEDRTYNVAMPVVTIKATKLNDYLKQQGHDEVATTSSRRRDNDDDFPLPPPRSRRTASSSDDDDGKLSKTVKAAFPLAKASGDVRNRDKVPILKSAVGSQKPLFLPRNMMVTSQSQAVKEAFNASSEPAEVDVMAKRAQNAQIVADARARIANEINLDNLYKPPKLRRKYGAARVIGGSDDDEHAAKGNDEDESLVKDDKPKKIVIGKLRSEAVKRHIPLVSYTGKRHAGEEGEIPLSEGESEQSDGVAGDDKDEDTEGEIFDDNESVRYRVASRQGTPASVRGGKKKEKRDKKEDKKKDEKKKKTSKRASSVDRKDRHRHRSRSRSRSRERHKERRPSPSDRPFRYGQQRRGKEITDNDRAEWPWSKGPERPSTRRRSVSPDTLKMIARTEVRGRRSRSRSRGRRRGHSRSRSRSHSRSVTPTPRDGEGRIDKKKLLAIAKRNATAMLQLGTLQQMRAMSAEELASLKSGGRSVEELIEFCTKLAKKEEKTRRRLERSVHGKQKGEKSSEESSEDDMEMLEILGAVDGGEIRHPFALKERTGITFNIANALSMPVKTPLQRAQEEAQLRIAFPVASGVQHKSKEAEDNWTPAISSAADRGERVPQAATGQPLPPPPMAPSLATADQAVWTPAAPPAGTRPAAMPAGFGPPQPPRAPVDPSDRVFDEPMIPPPAPAEGISDIVSQRLKAVKRLQENPNDSQAVIMLSEAEDRMKQWAASKNLPGQFTGSTGVQVLTREELKPTDKRYESWSRRDQFNVAPVSEGRGMSLLLKMGWRPGQGIGKNNEGALEPLTLDIKQDRRGLVAIEEMPASRNRPNQTFGKIAAGGHKHPISLLGELCQKRRWGPPIYVCQESGAQYNRRFLWKVTVNGVEYQPAVPSNNKKNGKVQSAQVVLQSLGLMPRDQSLPAVIS